MCLAVAVLCLAPSTVMAQPDFLSAPPAASPIERIPMVTADPPVLPDGAAGVAVEQILEQPVLEEPPVVPVWYNPLSWIGPYWNGSFSVGINGSNGTTDAFNIQTGFELSRETEITNWDTELRYNKAESNSQETAHNALFQTVLDRKFAHPRWTWFNKLGLEYDEFKNFDLRLFINTGLGYTFIDNEKTQLRGRFGSGVSREFGGDDDDYKPEAVFGFDFAHQLTERQRFTATVDYYPSWEDFSDYRLVTDIGWELLLDQATNLSLKVGVIDRYDSTPGDSDPNSVDYSVLLLWTM